MNYLLYNIIAHINMNFYLVMNGRTEEQMEGTDKNRPSRNLNLGNIKHYIINIDNNIVNVSVSPGICNSFFPIICKKNQTH